MEIRRNLSGGMTIGLSIAAIAGGAVLIAAAVINTAGCVAVIAAAIFTAIALGVGIASITSWVATKDSASAIDYFNKFKEHIGIGLEHVSKNGVFLAVIGGISAGLGVGLTNGVSARVSDAIAG